MTARAQAAGIRPISYAVVVNIASTKASFTLGPFRTSKKADSVAARMDAADGHNAWVDPIYAEADAAKILDLEKR